MNNKFFHGRVVIADRSTFFLLLLSVCFLAGALIGHRFAYTQAVCSDAGLQGLSGLFFLPAGARRSAGRALWRFADLLLQIPCLDFLSLAVSRRGEPFSDTLFYQGFSASFAVSAPHTPQGSTASSWPFLLFGLRWALVLPCCFSWRRRRIRTLTAAAPPPRGASAAPEGLYRVSRFAFCILLLGVGAF